MNRLIGAVSYLNTVPLVFELDQLAPEYRVVFDLPSRLCQRLHRGELDVALIPVVEAIDRDRWTVVSDACIGCRGPVWSVKLLSRVPLSRLSSLALDEGSRTSVALAQILLAEQFGVRPELTSLQIDEDFRLASADAVLVIGDRAIHPTDSEFPYVMDLGQAWRDWTGMPFVFAVWAASHDADLPGLSSILSQARDAGVSHIPELARIHAARHGLSEQQTYDYFARHLHFVLGDEERHGLQLFFEKGAAHGLLPHAAAVNFFEYEVA